MDRKRIEEDQHKPRGVGQSNAGLGEAASSLRRREKERLAKLKAELAAPPIATPLNSRKGTEDDDEMMMDVTEEGLIRMKDEELELRTMVAAKAGSNGEKLSAKRVQEISKRADDNAKKT